MQPAAQPGGDAQAAVLAPGHSLASVTDKISSIVLKKMLREAIERGLWVPKSNSAKATLEELA